MKKQVISLTAFLFISLISIQGQEKSRSGSQLGVNLFSVKYMSEDYLASGYKLCYPVGIIFKKNHDHFTSRYMLGYQRLVTTDIYHGGDDYSGQHKYSMLTLGTGIQKNINLQKMQILYGCDITSQWSRFKIDKDGGLTGDGVHETYNSGWIGISPFLGAQYAIGPRISASVETNYNLMFRVFNTDRNNVKPISPVQAYWNPISTLAICYNF